MAYTGIEVVSSFTLNTVQHSRKEGFMNEVDLVHQLWKQYYNAWSRLLRAKNLIGNQPNSQLLKIVKHGLSVGERGAVLDLMRIMNEEDLKLCLNDLLKHGSYFNAYTRGFQKLILSISKSWLIENIESYAEPILAQEDNHEEYSILMELFMQIDKGLAVRLAERAINNNDEDIREWGIDMLEELHREAS
jgi:hypothetical protein